MEKIKYLIAIALALSVVLIVGCTPPESPDIEENETTSQERDDSANEKNQVAAIVNGEEITTNTVKEMQQTYSQQGQQVSEEEALEQLVNREIILQEIKEKGLSVSTEEAENNIEAQLAQQNATLEQYKQSLKMQGISYEEQLASIKQDLAIQNYFNSLLDNINLSVSDEEARQFYEGYKQQKGGNISSYEELKPQMILAMQQEKQQQAINEIMNQLRENATIEYK
jgi:hypothetical protein